MDRYLSTKQSLQISYDGPLAKVSHPGVAGLTLTKQELEGMLASHGAKITQDVLRILVSVGIAHALPLHLTVACRIVLDQHTLRRLQGVRLDEFLFDLMGFERVRQLLSRRFFQTYSHRAEQEEPLWWAAEHLERALQVSVSEVRRIDSVEQLLCEGERVRQVLVVKRISLVPQP